MRPYVLLSIVAFLLCSAAALPAQITTVVVPPQPERPAEDPVEVRARRAERLEARIGEMREWVDSVALEVEADPAVPDTVPPDARRRVAVQAPPRTVPEPRAPPRAAVFRDGAPAPDTATPLPLLALLGVAALGAGALLRRR